MLFEIETCTYTHVGSLQLNRASQCSTVYMFIINLGFDRLERINRQTRETFVDPTAMSGQVGESRTSKVYNL